MPAWPVLIWEAVQWIPDWKHRIEFWLDAARSTGGWIGTASTIVASPYFSVCVTLLAIGWLLFVGEPARTIRDHRWRYVGWGIVAVFFVMMIYITGYGAIEIYIREQIATRQATILHDGTNPNAAPQPPDLALSYNRRLSPDQFREFVAQGVNLKPFLLTLLLTISPGDSEANILKTRFFRRTARAGIEIANGDEVPEGPDQTGIMIAVPDIHNPPETAKRLRDALEIIGIVPSYIPKPARIGTNIPILFIGPKPI